MKATPSSETSSGSSPKVRLAIVSAVVERVDVEHRGQIDVHPEPGEVGAGRLALLAGEVGVAALADLCRGLVGRAGKPLHLAALLVDHDQQRRVVALPWRPPGAGATSCWRVLLVARHHDHAAEPALPDAAKQLLARSLLADLADDSLADHALQRQRRLLLLPVPAADQDDQADDDEQGDSASRDRLAAAHLRREVAVAAVLAGRMRPPRHPLVLARAPPPLRRAGRRPALLAAGEIGLPLTSWIVADVVGVALTPTGSPSSRSSAARSADSGGERLALAGLARAPAPRAAARSSRSRRTRRLRTSRRRALPSP